MTNKLRDAWKPVKASPELKASTLDYLAAERERRSAPRSRTSWRKAWAAACVLLVLLAGLGGYRTTAQAAVAYVSIDVNPSVELALNRYDRVVSATACNPDGEIVLDGLDVKGQRYTEAIDVIVESEAMQTYLTGDAALTFTIAADSEAREETLRAGVESCSGCQAHGGESYGADLSAVAAAHDNHLSLGKYTAYLVLAQYDDAITPEDCQTMTMAELHHQIRTQEAVSGQEAATDGSCTTEENGQQGHGHGHSAHE